MSTPCYLPLAILKQALGITVTTSDDALNLKLAGVEQAIETFLGFNPAYATTTEYLDGSGGEVLVLTRKPVVSVTSVWEDPGGYYGTVADSFDATDTLLTSGEDYAVDVHGANKAGRLVRIGKSWPAMARRHRGSLADTWGKSRGTVKVTYVAGFQTGSVPADVLDAAVAEAAARWQVRTGGLGPKQSESLNGYSYSRADITHNVLGDGTSAPFLTPLLKAALRPYRNTPLGRS
jgi:hypothetical protein